MVDPINGVGPLQGVQKTQGSNGNQRKDETRENSTPQDEVRISAEALNLAEAEKASEEARVQLQNDPNAVLGLDPNFDGND